MSAAAFPKVGLEAMLTPDNCVPVLITSHSRLRPCCSFQNGPQQQVGLIAMELPHDYDARHPLLDLWATFGP